VAGIDPIDDGIANEAYKAIEMIFESIAVEPKVIILGGIHHGDSALRYLNLFPDAIIYGFEPNSENLALAKKNLMGYQDQIRLYPYALSSFSGKANLNVNSHDATHSLFEIGKIEYWDEHVDKMHIEQVKTKSLDSFCEEYGITNIDLLHLDIQGAELDALRGAANLFNKREVCLIRCESEFEEIYIGQPLFWDIGKFLSGLNYRFVKNVDNKYRSENVPRLVWADSLFLRSD
jgi:FkbM family methyltransferase